MVKVKLVDLFNVKFEQMENKINDEIAKIEKQGFKVTQVKILGESLKSASIFLIYE